MLQKAMQRKLSNSEGFPEEISTITSTGKSDKRILNKSKVSKAYGHHYLNSFLATSNVNLIKRKYSDVVEAAGISEVADEHTGLIIENRTVSNLIIESAKLLPCPIVEIKPKKKERKERCNTLVHTSSQCIITSLLPSNLSNDDDLQFNAIIADDNFTNQYVLKGLLKLFKVNAATVNNGEECVQLINSLIEKKTIHYVRIIFMDLQMPVMNGIEATKIIRKKMKECSIMIPVIGISSDNCENDRKNFYSAGICQFVAKPISKSTLEGILMEYMNLRK